MVGALLAGPATGALPRRRQDPAQSKFRFREFSAKEGTAERDDR